MFSTSTGFHENIDSHIATSVINKYTLICFRQYSYRYPPALRFKLSNASVTHPQSVGYSSARRLLDSAERIVTIVKIYTFLGTNFSATTKRTWLYLTHCSPPAALAAASVGVLSKYWQQEHHHVSSYERGCFCQDDTFLKFFG